MAQRELLPWLNGVGLKGMGGAVSRRCDIAEYRAGRGRRSRGGIARRGSFPSGAKVEILSHPTREVANMAKGWVVEGTLAWGNLYRGWSKDNALLPEVSEAAIYAVTIHPSLRRLAPA